MTVGKMYTRKLLILSACICLMHLSCVSSAGHKTKVLILGAGAAGLNAARVLQANNITDFIVLEGSSQTGGVIRQVDFGGLKIPSGEMWVYGDREELVDEVGFQVRESDYDSWIVRNDQGEDVTDEANERYEDLAAAEEMTNELAEMVLEGKRLDVSQKVALAMSGWVSSSSIDRLLEWFDSDFEEGLQSKRVSLVGPYYQDLLKSHGTEFLVTDYSQAVILQANLNDDNLKLNQVVSNIDQSGDNVVVTVANDGGEQTQYIADYVLVTFSVGVLQQGGVTFTPELPAWKTEQIFRFQRGTIEPILLKFSSKFWGDEQWILHASDRQDVDRHYYPAFLNWEAEGLYPAGSNILAAFVTAEEALRVEGLTDEEIMKEVSDVLKAMYGEENVSKLEEIHFERWASDPFHYGTFSSWPIPANIPEDLHERLAAKVGRVFFAEHASDVDDIGFTYGKLEASRLATTKIVGCLSGADCSDDFEPRPVPRPGSGDDESDEEKLFGCVLLPKKEGKTRKVVNNAIGANVLAPHLFKK